MKKTIIPETIKLFDTDYNSVSDEELKEYFEDMLADEAINEQKENTYYEP